MIVFIFNNFILQRIFGEHVMIIIIIIIELIYIFEDFLI